MLDSTLPGAKLLHLRRDEEINGNFNINKIAHWENKQDAADSNCFGKHDKQATCRISDFSQSWKVNLCRQSDQYASKYLASLFSGTISAENMEELSKMEQLSGWEKKLIRTNDAFGKTSGSDRRKDASRVQIWTSLIWTSKFYFVRKNPRHESTNTKSLITHREK